MKLNKGEVLYRCPLCAHEVVCLPAAEVKHDCPKRAQHAAWPRLVKESP